MGLCGPQTVVVGHRDTIPTGGTYGTGRATRYGDGVRPAGVVGVTEGLAGPRQGSRGPHQGPPGARGHYDVGVASTSTAPAGGAAGSPEGGHEPRPPDEGTTPAPSQDSLHKVAPSPPPHPPTPHTHLGLRAIYGHRCANTLHTACAQTHSPPVLHCLYARHPGHCHLVTAPSAHHTTPHHTAPHHTTPHRTAPRT